MTSPVSKRMRVSLTLPRRLPTVVIACLMCLNGFGPLLSQDAAPPAEPADARVRLANPFDAVDQVPTTPRPTNNASTVASPASADPPPADPMVTEQAIPADQASPVENPAAENPAAENPAAENPAAENPAAENPADAVHEGGVPERRAVESLGPRAADGQLEQDAVLQAHYRRGMVIDVRGPIFGGLKAYLENRLQRAQQSGADLVILRITSPGGELNASLELAHELSEIDWATVIAFIPDEAISGAAILSFGCERIYMRPRASIGDAGPIQFHGGMFEHAEEKVVSYLATQIRSIAESRGRPGAIAEAMVDRKLEVFEATDKQTGLTTFMTQRELEMPIHRGRFERGPAIGEAGQGRFLTVTGTRAVQLQIAERLFESEADLLAQLNVDQLTQTQRNWIDHTVYILNLPLVSGLLLVVGLIGLYLEFTAPGISVAGLTAIACFSLFFWSHALGGTSGWLEVILFVLGVACLGIELFVLPGFGVFGITGIILVVLSLVMASQDFLLPTSTVQWNTLRDNLLIVLGAVAAVFGLLVVQLTFFDSIPGLNRFRLTAPEAEGGASGGTFTSLTAGPDATRGFGLPELGALGVSESVLRPAGKVRFEDSLVDVVTEGDFLDAGTPVEVIKREGNRIIVRRTV
jgi:membrane-bound serine protease (ClpP class)